MPKVRETWLPVMTTTNTGRLSLQSLLATPLTARSTYKLPERQEAASIVSRQLAVAVEAPANQQ